jgi:ABC-type antimicrobial peptide transport system permease subunit
MLKNYFIIAIRHIAGHKMFSLINILCLAIGITFSMLIGVYILNQKYVNHDLKNYDRQYVIKSKWKVKDMGLPLTTVGPLAKSLKAEYPTLVANYFRYNPVTNVVSAGDKNFKENIAICDTTMVSMYGFKLLHGDEKQAFKNNNSAVITEVMAVKLFGTTNALNKTISIAKIGSGKQDYVISAVLKAMPYNSVTNFIDADGYNVFVPFEGSQYYPGTDGAGENNWAQIFMVGMVELQPGIHPKDLEGPVSKILTLNLPNNIKSLLVAEFAPVKDYYLSDNNAAVQKMITKLSIVAFFILIMAVINFININIGTSSYRLKEIGLRKVFGSAKKQLVIQHLTESMLLTFFAAILSLLFYEFVRPYFGQVLNTNLDSVLQLGTQKLLWLLILVFLVGTVSGIYPAFVLSSSNIIYSVKGKANSTRGGMMLRKALLIIQFSLAILIFISALNISRQVSYIFKKDIGYSKDQLLVLTTFPKQWDSAGVMRMEAIRNELQRLPQISSSSLSFEVPDRTPPNTLDLLPTGSNQIVVVPTIVADENFAYTFGLKLQQGDFFDHYKTSSARNEIVLNETAAKALSITSPKETVKMPSGLVFTVAGIIKDFNYSSLQQSIGPVAFTHIRDSPQYRYLIFKINSADMEGTIAALKDKWRSLSPNAPFEYTFMDQRFGSLYKSEVQLKRATSLATALNMAIVFMGIFGVVAFTLARRNKEIAVRKVLGAEARNIILLFLKDYALLILIANLIAWPVAYMATNQWLQNYSYRIEQNIIPYIMVFLCVFLLTFIFIVIQCLKTAMSNPVKSLRTE